MRTNEIRNLQLPPHISIAFCAYARARGTDPAELAASILRDWLRDQQGALAWRRESSGRGMQWKCLFLPEGTVVYPFCRGEEAGAKVVGNALLYKGIATSPRQLAVAVLGKGRNAWLELWIRFPGEAHGRSANALRKQCQQQADTPPSPMEVMLQAAAGMSDVLRNALAVIEQGKPVLGEPRERRGTHPRDDLDALEDG